MRSIGLLVLLVLGGCATKSVLPREFLDEQTAATITVVADPWIFTRKDAPPQLDFFNLYAIDVNRMGDHKKYFAVVHYWPNAELSANSVAPKLLLTSGAREFELSATSEPPREVGLAQPLDKSAPSSARTWLYPVDQEILRSIAQTRQLDARLVSGKVNALYAVWRDGSREMNEFATAFDR